MGGRGRSRKNPKVPRCRIRRSIVADDEFIKNETSFGLFSIGKNVTGRPKRNPGFNETVENTVKQKTNKTKCKPDDENFCPKIKKRNRRNNDSDSLPSSLKQKIAEINEINDNYELHITNENENKDTTPINRSNETNKSTDSFQKNTMQIGTSTPSIFGRTERKPCKFAEISQIEMNLNEMSTLFENSQISIHPNEMLRMDVDSDERSTQFGKLDDCNIPQSCSGSISRETQSEVEERKNEKIASILSEISYISTSQDQKISRDLFDSHSGYDTRQKSRLTKIKQINDASSIRSEQISENSNGRSFSDGQHWKVDERQSNKIARVELSNICIPSSPVDREMTHDLFHSFSDDDILEEDDQLGELINELSVDKLKHSMTINSMNGNTTKITLQSTKSFSRLSFSGVCSPYFMKTNSTNFDPRSVLFHACHQEDGPVSWDSAIPTEMMQKCIKIGEGTYGEVFKSVNRNGDSVAFKVIPIEGDFLVNDEPQKSFEEILPEVLIAAELSNLKDNEMNMTPNFIEVKNVFCVEGAYPEKLLCTWDDFALKRKSENDRPDMFSQEQLFIIFEFADGGMDLENFNFSSVEQAKSVLVQLTLTLAIAEKVLEFEHRDLHIGNVLVKKTKETFIEYEFDGYKLKVKSCGVHVYVIDFTNSRLHKDGCTIFTNLADDEAMFEGDGDYQFDIYRLMRKENENEWKHFEPKTNLLWLHYITDKLIKFKKYKGKSMGAKCVSLLEKFAEELFDHSSCEDFIVNNDVDFVNEIFAL